MPVGVSNSVSPSTIPGSILLASWQGPGRASHVDSVSARRESVRSGAGFFVQKRGEWNGGRRERREDSDLGYSLSRMMPYYILPTTASIAMGGSYYM